MKRFVSLYSLVRLFAMTLPVEIAISILIGRTSTVASVFAGAPVSGWLAIVAAGFMLLEWVWVVALMQPIWHKMTGAIYTFAALVLASIAFLLPLISGYHDPFIWIYAGVSLLTATLGVRLTHPFSADLLSPDARQYFQLPK